MGVAARYFLIEEDGTVRKIAAAKFHRLTIGGSEERMREYAGKRVRYAAIYLDLIDREPAGIRTMDFGYLLFHKNGRFDPSEWNGTVRTAIDSWLVREGASAANVVNARGAFAKRRIEHEHRWKPDENLLQAILRLAFGEH